MKAWLRTLGCRANQADSEQLRAALRRRGVAIVDRAADADVAIFNSCAVTADAEADLRQGVRRASRENAQLMTVVMGCAAALDRGTIAALPSVRAVVAGADIDAVLFALGIPPIVARDADVPAGPQTSARALLRIQDGCAEHCTFCATTVARGAHRSRSADALVAESRVLAEWHPEIVLTGTHIGHYGTDCQSSLGELVGRLVREVPHVRFRLTSVEATEVDDALAALLRDGGRDCERDDASLAGSSAAAVAAAAASWRVAPCLHAPLQSGSDAVLRRMGRHWYTAASYARAVERLVRDRGVFALGADVIAGFPGETEADHRATVTLVEALPFTYLHVFPFSERPDAPATRLGAAVAPPDIARRANELRTIGARKAASYAASRVDGMADVVVTGTGRRRAGLTEDYLSVLLEDASLPRRSRFAARLVRNGDGRLVARPAGSGNGAPPEPVSTPDLFLEPA